MAKTAVTSRSATPAPTPRSTSPARVLFAPDSFPWVGLPGTAWEDGTVIINEDSGELYFWNAHNPHATNKWEPLI